MLTVPRRSEFHETRPEVARAVLREARYGHLAAVGPDGLPQVVPLNYALVGDRIYLHGSPRSFLGELEGRPVCLAVEDTVTWIPSTWRHPEMACPATTYYRSVQVRGRLRSTGDLDEKARALQAFMERYQPEGGHRPLNEPQYRGPLAALAVMSLDLEDWTCRVKMGQHLDPESRRRVHDRLVERGDRHCAARMRRANPDLQEPDAATLWTDDPDAVPIDQLHALLDRTYWAAGRPRPTVERHLRESALAMAGLEDGRLVAYARVGSPGRGIAYLFDVVVLEERRGQGLGRQLLERVLAHPRMAAFPRIFLDTRDAMALYRRFGFKELLRSPRNGGSTLMLRELLPSSPPRTGGPVPATR